MYLTRRFFRMPTFSASWLSSMAACACIFLSGCVSQSQTVGLPQDARPTITEPDVVILSNSEAAFAIYDDGFDLDMANADIWQRIRQGFQMPDLETDLVTEKEQWYAARPRYFMHTGQRARRYIYYIVEELERRNMPMELALLPFLESAFNPEAVSSAQAAGMWQFIPSTGRNFSLQQDIFRDERRDVIASTNAALDYLQKLHGMFNDWHLALAAYNCGEGTVIRAIERNRRDGKPTDYASLNLPRETQGYVPTLQALKNMVADPLGYKLELPLIPNHPFFQALALERDIDVALAAQLAGISVDEFKALNPAANKPVLLAEITTQILLPWDNAEVFLENLNLYQGQLSTWTVWKAPRTMSVAQVARATSMQEAVLREVNEIPPNVLVRQGSVLLIHRTQAHQDNVALNLLENASLDFARSGGRLSTPSKVAVAPQHSNVVVRHATPSKVAVAAPRQATPAQTAQSVGAGSSSNVAMARVQQSAQSSPSKVAAR